MADKITTTLRTLLSIPTKISGAGVFAAAILAYFALVFHSGFSGHYLGAWRHLGVPTLSPSFADLRNITTGVDWARHGGNPIASDPYDPWHRPMNYPRVWIVLLSLFHVHQSDTVALGIGLAILFLTAVLLLIRGGNGYTGAVYALIGCSPAVMLGVERGNNDLVLFCLLAVALAWLQTEGVMRSAAYVLLGVCSVLKLYPIFAFILAFRENRRTGVAIVAAACVLFAVYVAVTWTDIKAIAAAVPRGFAASYGSAVLFDWLRAKGVRVPGHVIAGVACAAVAAFAFRAGARQSRPPVTRSSADAMTIGATLYAVTFALGNNFNYRLVFLIFCLPALLECVRGVSPWSKPATGTLLTLVISVWLCHFTRNSGLFLVDKLAEWVLFALAVTWLTALLRSRTAQDPNVKIDGRIDRDASSLEAAVPAL